MCSTVYIEPVLCVIVQVVEQGPLKALSSSVNTMQRVLEEAGQLLKLVWRVSLPSRTATSNQQVHTRTHTHPLNSVFSAHTTRLST